jgi:hypothetical protein
VPPFGSRKSAPPPAESTQPQPAQESAADRLAALVSEQASIERQLAEHRDERARLLREDGQLGAIRTLATEDESLRLRLEQIAIQINDLQAVIERQRLAHWEAAWLSHRPALAEAEAQLEAAIRDVYVALEHAHEVHNAAQRNGFGTKLGEFVRPPPLMLNDWAARQYVATIERRQQAAQAVAPMI